MATQRANGSLSFVPRHFRRQFVINPRFQWKYIAMATLAVFLISTVMGVAVYVIQFREAQRRLLSTDWARAPENTAAIAAGAMTFAAFMAVLIGVWCVLLTHRICGPLYVVRQFLDEMIAGRLPQRRPLRKKDEFVEFYEHFFRAVDVLKSSKQAEIAVLEDAMNAARSVLTADGDAKRPRIEAVVARLEVLRAECERMLGVAGPVQAESDASRSRSDARPSQSTPTACNRGS